MYGTELRERIIAARQRGIPVNEISRVFGVSQRMVFELCRRHRETQSVASDKSSGRPSKLTPQDLQNIEQQIRKCPDITLQQLITELSLPVSKSSLSRAVRSKLGYTYVRDASRGIWVIMGKG